MTERILRALNETDEQYILAYAETMKAKDPKKIVLRRWIAAAAAVLVLVGVVFSLPPVRYALLTRPVYSQQNFSSFTEMMSALDIPQHETSTEQYSSPSQTFSYGSRLSLIDFDSYDAADYYFCYEQSRYYTLAMLPLTFVCDLTKDGVRYEVANYKSSDSTAVPKPFRNMKKYTNTLTVNGILISYENYRDRVECEFTDATGYYKIICHSGDLNDLYAILGKLLQYNFETWEAYP
ncbi:MAG: hypothetical protein IJK98_10230 [Clostridia bacterium]|nr:hypothetical protein [Clostridia bacterium]